jgi:hypothetical protein
MAAATPFVVTITAVDKATASVRKIKASFANLTKPARDLKSSFSSFGREVGVDRVAKSMKSLGTAAADAGRSVASLITPLTAIAGLGSIAGIALLANEWGKMGAEVERTSGVLGVSTDQLQAYRGAAKLAGLSADDMTGSLKSLGRTIEDATFGRNQDALVMMQKFGISLHRTKDGAVDATRALKDVANAIVAQKGNVQAQSLIAGAFGVESLLPLLQKGSGGIEAFVKQAKEMGLVFDEKTLKDGEKFNANMLKLEASATRLKYQFGNAMAPGVERLVNAVGSLVDKYGQVVATKVAEYVERFAKWVDGVDWDKAAKSVGEFIDKIGGVKGVALAIAAITFAGPIASVLSLIANLALLTTTTVPAAVTALARLAGGPVMAAVLALLHSEDLNTGEDEEVGKHQPKPGQKWDGDPIGQRRRAGAANDPQTAGIVDRLQKMGWSQQQAAGIAANLWTESLYNPNVTGDGGRAYGIGQWHEDRQADFKKLFGIDIQKSSLDQQLQFVDYELRHGEKKAGDALSKTTTAGEAAGVISRFYERPAPKDEESARGLKYSQIEMGKRASYANAIAEKLPSLYAKQPKDSGAGNQAPVVASNQPGASFVGPPESAKIHVDVHLHNAPAGTKATASVRGNGSATARVGTSNVTGPPV